MELQSTKSKYKLFGLGARIYCLDLIFTTHNE